MASNDLITTFKGWYTTAQQIELTFESDFANSGVNYEFFLMHIKHARMYAGDIARIWIRGVDYRSGEPFIPAQHGMLAPKPFDVSAMTKKEVILLLKSHLRALFYDVIDADGTAFHINIVEYRFYQLQLAHYLKSADQQLGLMLGQITD